MLALVVAAAAAFVAGTLLFLPNWLPLVVGALGAISWTAWLAIAADLWW